MLDRKVENRGTNVKWRITTVLLTLWLLGKKVGRKKSSKSIPFQRGRRDSAPWAHPPSACGGQAGGEPATFRLWRTDGHFREGRGLIRSYLKGRVVLYRKELCLQKTRLVLSISLAENITDFRLKVKEPNTPFLG
jgi:hypothetical protein